MTFRWFWVRISQLAWTIEWWLYRRINTIKWSLENVNISFKYHCWRGYPLRWSSGLKVQGSVTLPRGGQAPWTTICLSWCGGDSGAGEGRWPWSGSGLGWHLSGWLCTAYCWHGCGHKIFPYVGLAFPTLICLLNGVYNPKSLILNASSLRSIRKLFFWQSVLACFEPLPTTLAIVREVFQKGDNYQQIRTWIGIFDEGEVK